MDLKNQRKHFFYRQYEKNDRGYDDAGDVPKDELQIK